MSGLPQLIMRKEDITCLPPIFLKEGMEILCHKENCGMEEIWEDVIESAFGRRYSFSFLIKAGDYRPEHVLYLSYNGQIIATATAVESPTFPGVGWYRMVGVRKDAQGVGAGKIIAMAALHALRQRGFTSAMLSTDDERLPAIRLYRSLGFEPYMNHESHEERWEKVLDALKKA